MTTISARAKLLWSELESTRSTGTGGEISQGDVGADTSIGNGRRGARMAFGWTRSPATEAGGRGPGSTAEWERARGEGRGNRRVGGWDEREGAAAGTTPALGARLIAFTRRGAPPSAAEKRDARAGHADRRGAFSAAPVAPLAAGALAPR